MAGETCLDGCLNRRERRELPTDVPEKNDKPMNYYMFVPRDRTKESWALARLEARGTSQPRCLCYYAFHPLRYGRSSHLFSPR